MDKFFTTNFIVFALAFILPVFSYSQKSISVDSLNLTVPDKIIDETEKRSSPASVIVWDESLRKSPEGHYNFTIKTPIEFTSFGIGWEAENKDYPASSFEVIFRVSKDGKEWSEYYSDDGYVHPDETPRNLYFTDLLFPPTEEAYRYIEFTVVPPRNNQLNIVRLDLIDIRGTGEPGPTPEKEDLFYRDEKTCPPFPAMIPRSEWCGVYTACHNPTYSPTYINATHAIMHHGASPDTYTDGYAIVRSYWNYHVNTLGWADIGYNYLFDKYGNFFLGRHNPNVPNSDVRAAHAGYSNSSSIGVNFLGNSDVTLPTAPQLIKNNEFLAWWFHYKNLDPTSSASLTLQNGSTGVRPRICGHRDVHATACPGNALYAELPGIRTNTKAIIDACNDTNPPTTSIAISTHSNWVNNDFTASFNDIGHGSTIDRRFYQVLEYDGSYWGANYNRGFFGDNFENLTTNPWTIITGNWHTNNGALIQSDEANSNTNIYAPLNQELSNRYLYQFYAKAEGSDNNKRFGFHFFADDGSLTNRGNSYFIWFRIDGQSLQFYKVENNTFSLVEDISGITTNAGQWYDYKVIYDRITGEILVYRDNVFLGSWTDPSPYSTNGNYISFRTGNTQLFVNELKVFRTRHPEMIISVGIDADKDLRYQSINPVTPGGKIKSIVSDNAGNLSEIAHFDIFVDWTKPETAITTSVEGQWVTQNFNVEFTDTDNNSGIDRRFYQASEFNGNRWTANTNRGFFYDDFELIDINLWTEVSGSWSVINNELVQSDASENNTNIYAPLNQTLSNRYLYNFTAKLEGPAHTNGRRFGMHFFSDDGSLPNRGNSYFIFLRHEAQRLEFYKVTNDVFSQEKIIENIDVELGRYYDYKIIYDRITGEMLVFRDELFLGSWTDPSPFSHNGNYISFRTGNSNISVQNIHIYRTRHPEMLISIGEENENDIRTQSPNPETIGGKIKSVVVDAAGNFSQIVEQGINIDYTSPETIQYVHDGLGEDINQTESLTELSANWGESSDPHSGLIKYYYAIGTAPGSTNIVGWTDNGLSTAVTHTGLNLSNGETYYFSVKAENGAGLLSYITSSSGQTVITEAGPVNLQHTLHGCPNNEVTFSWENSGSGWYIQICTSPEFTNPYWKWVSGLTSYTGPEGFESQDDGSPLVFVDGETYFWRLHAEGEWTNTLNFTLPYCDCSPISYFPYVKNFDNGESVCWSLESTAQVTWDASEAFVIAETYTIEPVSGSHLYRCLWTDTESQDEWFISPEFNLNEITVPKISFYFSGSYNWSVTNPNCNLDILAKIDSNDWIHLWNHKEHPEFTSNDINYQWLLTELELDKFPFIESLQFAFRYSGFDGATFSIDNVIVNEADINILAGDINGDSKINILDIVFMVNHLNGNTLENFLWYNADINGDGVIDVSDLSELINVILQNQ